MPEMMTHVLGPDLFKPYEPMDPTEVTERILAEDGLRSTARARDRAASDLLRRRRQADTIHIIRISPPKMGNNGGGKLLSMLRGQRGGPSTNARL